MASSLGYKDLGEKLHLLMYIDFFFPLGLFPSGTFPKVRLLGKYRNVLIHYIASLKASVSVFPFPYTPPHPPRSILLTLSFLTVYLWFQVSSLIIPLGNLIPHRSSSVTFFSGGCRRTEKHQV